MANKPTIVIFMGLAGSGKRTIIDELMKQISVTKIEKDIVSDNLLDGQDHTSDAYAMVAPNIYQVMSSVALDNLRENDSVAILQGYYGDKLTKPKIKELLENTQYNIKLVYVHCSAATQLERIEQRALARDDDKRGEKYGDYRSKHIRNHLQNIVAVDGPVLLLDTDESSAAINAQKVLDFMRRPQESLKVKETPYSIDITKEDAYSGLETFKRMLSHVVPEHPALAVTQKIDYWFGSSGSLWQKGKMLFNQYAPNRKDAMLLSTGLFVGAAMVIGNRGRLTA